MGLVTVMRLPCPAATSSFFHAMLSTTPSFQRDKTLPLAAGFCNGSTVPPVDSQQHCRGAGLMSPGSTDSPRALSFPSEKGKPTLHPTGHTPAKEALRHWLGSSHLSITQPSIPTSTQRAAEATVTIKGTLLAPLPLPWVGMKRPQCLAPSRGDSMPASTTWPPEC